MTEDRDSIIRRMIVSEGKTYKETGDAVGLSKQRVQQICQEMRIATKRSWTVYPSKSELEKRAIIDRRNKKAEYWTGLVQLVLEGQPVRRVAIRAGCSESALQIHVDKARRRSA